MSNSCNIPNNNRQVGRVISQKGNKALVEFENSQACSSCALKTCSSSNQVQKPVWAMNNINAKKSERVVIEQSSMSYVFSAILVFIVPIGILLLSLLLLQNYFNETTTLLIAIFCSITYFLVGKFIGLFNYFEKYFAYKIIMPLKDIKDL